MFVVHRLFVIRINNFYKYYLHSYPSTLVLIHSFLRWNSTSTQVRSRYKWSHPWLLLAGPLLLLAFRSNFRFEESFFIFALGGLKKDYECCSSTRWEHIKRIIYIKLFLIVPSWYCQLCEGGLQWFAAGEHITTLIAPEEISLRLTSFNVLGSHSSWVCSGWLTNFRLFFFLTK